jgi:hypothetical protein
MHVHTHKPDVYCKPVQAATAMPTDVQAGSSKPYSSNLSPQYAEMTKQVLHIHPPP